MKNQSWLVVKFCQFFNRMWQVEWVRVTQHLNRWGPQGFGHPTNITIHPSIHHKSDIPKQVMVDIGLGHLAALASILATLVQKMSVKLPDCFWTVLVSVHSCCYKSKKRNMQHFFQPNLFKTCSKKVNQIWNMNMFQKKKMPNLSIAKTNPDPKVWFVCCIQLLVLMPMFVQYQK